MSRVPAAWWVVSLKIFGNIFRLIVRGKLPLQFTQCDWIGSCPVGYQAQGQTPIHSTQYHRWEMFNPALQLKLDIKFYCHSANPWSSYRKYLNHSQRTHYCVWTIRTWWKHKTMGYFIARALHITYLLGIHIWVKSSIE